jgi:hypothetical protein
VQRLLNSGIDIDINAINFDEGQTLLQSALRSQQHDRLSDQI